MPGSQLLSAGSLAVGNGGACVNIPGTPGYAQGREGRVRGEGEREKWQVW